MGAELETDYLGHSHAKSFIGRWWAQATSPNLNNRDDIYKEVDESGDAEVSSTLFHSANNHLSGNIDKVFTDKEMENYEYVNTLKRNVADFAVHKAQYFTEALKGITPEQRTAVLNAYERQLKVEGNLTTRSVRMAKKWVELESKKHLFPNLEYLPSRSADPRDEHAVLYGTIKPFDDPFWDAHYPPSDWGCKCDVRNTRKEETGLPKHLPKRPKGIPGNVAKTKQIFADDNSFKRNVTEEGATRANANLEKFKQAMPYGKPNFKLENGSKIYVHPYADEGDIASNLETVKLTATKYSKVDFRIRPHSNNVKTGIGNNKASNPELEFNGVFGDQAQWKDNSTLDAFIENSFGKRRRQLRGLPEYGLAIDFYGNLKEHDTGFVMRRLKGKLNVSKSLKWLLIKNNNNVFLVSMDDILDKERNLEIQKGLLK